ncbi:uncharacterized protein M421DRAFT_408904 [Didymella exigua CBS 183.55]|uniref:Uncharacterized protein n=1 Tax=Didymella exigua CBS 183.55 TaxID=1150837 RepID=A0A6A5RUT2_9PLEO|nr:uncharacterized protein M421DRAFT_408904 [Didymella exigua CBS 183.55]KAF1931329.1 hypothetical protein M421DRAFT_408904 [Didymella exigua CBS 183.55]
MRPYICQCLTKGAVSPDCWHHWYSPCYSRTVVYRRYWHKSPEAWRVSSDRWRHSRRSGAIGFGNCSGKNIVSTTSERPPITLAPGAVVSLSPSGTALVVGGTTAVLPQVFSAAPQSGAAFVLSGTSPGGNLVESERPQVQNIDAQDESGPIFVILGQTIAPGGPPTTVSSSTLSFAPFGCFLVINGTLTALATLAAIAASYITPTPPTIGNGISRPMGCIAWLLV